MYAALLGPRLPDVFGFFPREDAREAPELWIQSWDRGYRELSIADLDLQTELNALAVDAAVQLAGHSGRNSQSLFAATSASRSCARLR